MTTEVIEETGEVVNVGASLFEGDAEDLVKIGVPSAKTGALLGTMFLKRVPQSIRDKYRDILNGVGRKKGKPQAARQYLFKKAFVRFDFEDSKMQLALGKHKEPVEFFINECDTVVDAVIIQYHQETFPDVETFR